MTDDKKKGISWADKDGNWSTEAKVGAAVGSAALVAALLYAGTRKRKRKIEPQSPDLPPAPPAPKQTGHSE